MHLVTQQKESVTSCAISLNLISLFLDSRARRTFRPHAAQRGNGNILATMIYGPQIRSATAAAAEGPRCAARPPRQPTCAANEPLPLYKLLPAPTIRDSLANGLRIPRDKFGLVLVTPQPTTTIGEHAMRVFCAVSYILEQPSR